MDLDDVRREALHDWLNERPPRERPDPSEYEDDPDDANRAPLAPRSPRIGEGTATHTS